MEKTRKARDIKASFLSSLQYLQYNYAIYIQLNDSGLFICLCLCDIKKARVQRVALVNFIPSR